MATPRTTSIVLDEQRRQRLRLLAAARDQSMSDIIRLAIDQFLGIELAKLRAKFDKEEKCS